MKKGGGKEKEKKRENAPPGCATRSTTTVSLAIYDPFSSFGGDGTERRG